MKSLNVLALSLTAMCVFIGMAATSPAFAAKEFLADGQEIKADLELRMFHEVILRDLTNGAEMLCVMSFDALTEDGKRGFINEVLMSGGTLLAEAGLNLALEVVTGDHIECMAVKVCEGASVPLIVAINLPWPWAFTAEGHLEIGAESEYEFVCRILGLPFENVCGGKTELSALNDPVLGDAAVQFTGAPEMSCDNGDTLEFESDVLATVNDPDGSLITVN